MGLSHSRGTSAKMRTGPVTGDSVQTGPSRGDLDKETATSALTGLRVIDCSRGTAGVRATGLLADHGADVIWIEPPGGDPYRERLRIEYAVFNRGKRSAILDLKKNDSSQLRELLASADVFVHSWRPGVAERLGLDFDTVHDSFPALVYGSISGFGPGPHNSVPGYEPLVHAIVGTMGEQFGHREGPIFEALPFASIGAAGLLNLGLLAALFRRSRDGIGRQVETSLLDGALVFLSMLWGDRDGDNEMAPSGTGSGQINASGDSTRLVCQSFRCADDEYVGVHTGAVGAFGRLMKLLGLDGEIPSSTSGLDMGVPLTEHEKTVLRTRIHDIFASKPRDVWVDELTKADVCGVPQLHTGEVFGEEQVLHNRIIQSVEDPTIGKFEFVGPAARLELNPTSPPRPAPLPGAHTAEILSELGQTDAREVPWCGAGEPDTRPPLADILVVDFGAYFAGPYASRLLADLGARVIKIEPLLGDPLRGLPGLFRAAQLGKQSLAANLKDPAVAAVIRKLLSQADVVHHNLRPGAAERLGIGYEDVRALRSDVVYGYAPGWGSSGPLAGRQSFEPMISGYVGIGFEVAGQFNPPLYPAGNADPGNGLAGAIATMLALLVRDRTGSGQRFENAQLNTALSHVAHIVRTADGEVLGAEQLDPLQFGFSALERLYETTDGWICLVVSTEEQFARLGPALEIDLVSDERFRDPESRREHDYQLSDRISDALAKWTTGESLNFLRAAGVPVAEPRPYNNLKFMRDPQNARDRRVVEFPDSDGRKTRQVGSLIRISHAQERVPTPAPRLGEHSDRILTEAGLDSDQIRALRERGSVL